MSGVYWGLAGTLGTQGSEGVSGGLGAPSGCRGPFGRCQGCIGASRDCRYSGAKWGIGALGAPRGCRGLFGGVRGVLGWQVDWQPNHIGPSTGSQHSHWFHWGSDLPGQGQASDRNELCRLLYTFGTIFHDSFHICIYATSSHILTCNIKKCYMDYFLCRPIYTCPYTINVTYYYRIVLIMKNYFSHQIS